MGVLLRACFLGALTVSAAPSLQENAIVWLPRSQVSSPAALEGVACYLELPEGWYLASLSPWMEKGVRIVPPEKGTLYLVENSEETLASVQLLRLEVLHQVGPLKLLSVPEEKTDRFVQKICRKYRLGEPFPYHTETSTPVRASVTVDSRIQGLASQVTTKRMRNLLTILQGFQTRYSTTIGCRNAVYWVRDFFTGLGLQPRLQNHTAGHSPQILATLPGRSGEMGKYLLCAHLDSISENPMVSAPGVEDNATGSAAVLLAAEILSAWPGGFYHNIEFATWTGEEFGLYGSQYDARTEALNQTPILGVLNFDMIGDRAKLNEDLDIVVNRKSVVLLQAFEVLFPLYSAVPLNPKVDDHMVWSDHSSFWRYGYPALLGIDNADIVYPYYHTTQDTLDKVEPDFEAEVVKGILGALAALARPIDEGIELLKWELVDSQAGDGDGRLDPGERVRLDLELLNNTSADVNVTATLSSGEAGVQVLAGDWGPVRLRAHSKLPTISLHPSWLQASPTLPVPETVQLSLEIVSQAGRRTFPITVTATTLQYECPFTTETLDQDPGWNIVGTRGGWEFGIPLGMGGVNSGTSGYPDPVAGFTGDYVYGTNLAGNYYNGERYFLTSTPFDLASLSRVELHYRRWLNCDDTQFDFAKIKARANGGAWRDVWANTGAILDSGWQDEVLPLGTWADNQIAIQLQFSLETFGMNNFSGWNIDDIMFCGEVDRPFLTPTPTPEVTNVPTSTPTATPTTTADPCDPMPPPSWDAIDPYLSGNQVRLSWTYSSSCPVDAFEVSVYANGSLLRQAETGGMVLTFRNLRICEPLEFHLRAFRNPDRVASTSVVLTVTLLGDPPRVWLAGYWDTYLVAGVPGDMRLVRLLPDGCEITSEELTYNGVPLGIPLSDVASYMPVTFPSPGQFLLGIRVGQLGGATANWPYLEVQP